MKKYKYKREERLNKFEWDLDYSLENLLKDLLATNSKEECKCCKFVLNGIIRIDDEGKCIYCGKQI